MDGGSTSIILATPESPYPPHLQSQERVVWVQTVCRKDAAVEPTRMYSRQVCNHATRSWLRSAPTLHAHQQQHKYLGHYVSILYSPNQNHTHNDSQRPGR